MLITVEPQVLDVADVRLDVMRDLDRLSRQRGSAWLIQTSLRSQVRPPPSTFRKLASAREGDDFRIQLGKRIPWHPTAH